MSVLSTAYNKGLAGRWAARLLAGSATELVLEGNDYTVCKCKIHQVVVCGVEGAEGCMGEKPGFHRVVQALYGTGGPVTFCHAEVATRRNDQKLSILFLSEDLRYEAYAVESLPNEVKKFGGDTNFQYEAFGAFYCHLGGVRFEYRMRVARILGPKPLIVDVVRAMKVCGRSEMQRAAVVKVGDGLYHLNPLTVERHKGAGLDLFLQLLAILEKEGDTVRIGARTDSDSDGGVRLEELSSSDGDAFEEVDRGLVEELGPDRAAPKDDFHVLRDFVIETGMSSALLRAVARDVESRASAEVCMCYEQVEAEHGLVVPVETWSCVNFTGNEFLLGKKIQAWLEGAGVEISKRALVDLEVVALAPSHQQSFAYGARDRFKVLGMVGDALFKVYLTLVSSSRFLTAGETSVELEKASNGSLKNIAIDRLLVEAIGSERFPHASTKSYGDFVEGIVGTVFIHCGYMRTIAFVQWLIDGVEIDSDSE